MYTNQETAFLEWMEDHHASDMLGAVVNDLLPQQQEMAWRLVEADVLDCAQSLQTGREETVVYARGPWLLNQWNRTKAALPANAEQIQLHHMGFEGSTYFVIVRVPGPLSSVEILQLLPALDSVPPYRTVAVPTSAKTVVEALEQLNGRSYEEKLRQQMLKDHPY